MSQLQHTLEETYYTILFLIACEIVALSIVWRNRKKFPELHLFYIYPIAGFLQGMAFLISVIFFKSKDAMAIQETSVNVFIVIEVGLYYSVTIHLLRRGVLRFCIYCCLAGFLAYCTTLWLTTNSFFHNSSRIYPLEGVMMLIPACIYFVNLFRNPTLSNLFDQPQFWISIGMLFTFSCLLPLSFLEFFIQRFLISNSDLYYIGFLCYAINYSMISRAYLCRRKPMPNNLETSVLSLSESK